MTANMVRGNPVLVSEQRNTYSSYELPQITIDLITLIWVVESGTKCVCDPRVTARIPLWNHVALVRLLFVRNQNPLVGFVIHQPQINVEEGHRLVTI
jgi:hypothetical protein